MGQKRNSIFFNCKSLVENIVVAFWVLVTKGNNKLGIDRYFETTLLTFWVPVVLSRIVLFTITLESFENGRTCRNPHHEIFRFSYKKKEYHPRFMSQRRKWELPFPELLSVWLKSILARTTIYITNFVLVYNTYNLLATMSTAGLLCFIVYVYNCSVVLWAICFIISPVMSDLYNCLLFLDVIY